MRDTLLHEKNFRLFGLDRVNILLGRNGCGKSRLLREVEQTLHGPEVSLRYIPPERAGELEYNPNVDQHMADPANLRSSRRGNQMAQFRQQSVAQFRQLELAVLREIETAKRADTGYTFARYVDRINKLLERIDFVRDTADRRGGFGIRSSVGREVLAPKDLSSGESELVALAIEIQVFGLDSRAQSHPFLLLDEPDVHLHPDLQARLAELLTAVLAEHDFQVIIATHSTALLAALATHEGTRVCFMKPGERDLTFRPITPLLRDVLPAFGAHPLSRVFNESPVLFLEGDDDVRIWQQVVRSTSGRVKLYPVACGSEPEMVEHERTAEHILGAVYDDPTAFSLRDGDGKPGGELQAVGPVRRFRLHCYATENLLLTDEVLARAGTTWPAFQAGLRKWMDQRSDHPKQPAVRAFIDGGFDRTAAKLKEFRNILIEILDETRPWEVVVGQAIAVLGRPSEEDYTTPGHLAHALGGGCVEALRLIQTSG